jgi:hypothetical protein
MQKGQSTIEYLIIMTIVIGITLVIISLTMDLLSLETPVKALQNKNYWSSGAFSLTETIVDPNGDSIFVIKNNSDYRIYLAGYSIDGTTVSIDNPQLFLPQ